MSKTLDIMAGAVEHRPHSFQFIRKATGLKMTDQEFAAMAQSDLARFKLVRLLKRGRQGIANPPGSSRRGPEETTRGVISLQCLDGVEAFSFGFAHLVRWQRNPLDVGRSLARSAPKNGSRAVTFILPG